MPRNDGRGKGLAMTTEKKGGRVVGNGLPRPKGLAMTREENASQWQ